VTARKGGQRLKTSKLPAAPTSPASKTAAYRFDKAGIRKLLSDHYPLLSVLAAFMLVALSVGPYHNSDTTWEFDAVEGVMRYGLPYANGCYLMDQPPLGFYIQAGFFSVFGLSIENGTFLVTLFGLGCVALMYAIGALLYNRTTGFFAALLFALSPWHLILSRTFLIDTQCLFFSLAALFMGVLAVRRNSGKLCVASGIFFAAAFVTKLYAVYMLIPLAALFLYRGPRRPSQMLGWIAGFSIPVILAAFVWYQAITGIGLSSIFLHTDFSTYNAADITPTFFFVSNLLADYVLGWFFLDAAVLALLVCLVQKQLFRKFLVFDLICAATIICILTVNVVLGAVLDLKAPYLNAIKYDYQALPFFSLLAASLVTKGLTLLDTNKTRTALSRAGFKILAFGGFFLVAAAVLFNMRYEHLFSMGDYLIFRVERGTDWGYSLFNSAPVAAGSPLMLAQFAGFGVALSGLVWISRHRLISLLSALRKSKRRFDFRK